MGRHCLMRGLLLLLAPCLVSLAGCGLLRPEPPDPCAPVDVGGECFTPSHEAFIAHALESAGAWPQLDGVALSADRVVEGDDLTNQSVTWVVPIVSEGRMVAISRFLPAGRGQVKLAEVALLEEPLPPLPDDLGGELVLFVNPGCADDSDKACLFSEYGWALQLDDGRYRMPDGEVVETLPRTVGSDGGATPAPSLPPTPAPVSP